MKVFKTCLKVFFVCLLLGYFASSCSYGWSYTDWVDYLGQLRVRDDVSTTWKNKINTFFQYESLFAEQLSGYTNFYFNMDYGGAEVFATNNTLTISRVNQQAGYAPIQFTKNIRWEDFYISSGKLIHSYTNISSLNAYPGLIEVAEEYEALFNERMWFQNKYDLGFTFDPVGVTEVNYNGYQGLNAKKVNSNLVTLGTLTKPSEKYKYYRFKLFDSGGNLIGWLNYNTDNDYYSSSNIDAFLTPLTIYVQRRLIYLQEIYTLVIYAADEPFNNDDTNVDDSQIETFIFLPQNAIINGDTITNPGSGDSYTIQDSTNDLINNLYNDGSGDSPGIVQQIYDDLFTLKEDDFDNIYGYASSLFPSGDVMAVNDIIFSTLHPSGDDFVIAWEDVPIQFSLFGGAWSYSGDFISANSINFSRVCRENEQLGLLKFWINIFMQVSFTLAYIYAIYKCILIVIGVSTELVPQTEERKPIGFMQGGYHK